MLPISTVTAVCAGPGEETSSSQGEKHLAASFPHSEDEKSAPENGHAGWPINSNPTDADTSPPTKIALANGSGTATDEEKGTGEQCASNETGCTTESRKEYAMEGKGKVDPDEESAPENGTTVWSGEESATENEDLVGPEAEKRVPENGHGAESEKESSMENVKGTGSEDESAQGDENASGSEGKSTSEDKDDGLGEDSALEKEGVKVSAENAGMCMSRCRLCGEVMLHHLLRAHLKSLHRRTSVLNTFDMINTTYHR
jgi:hypothetical protein